MRLSKKFFLVLGGSILIAAVAFGLAEAASKGSLLDLSSPVSFPVDI